MTHEALRSTVADVDLDAIAANVRALRDRAKADVIAVVKADAYGHGAEAVAEACFEAGAVMLAVATVEEAVALREAGIAGPVLVMSGATEPAEVARAVADDLVLTVWDESRARAVSEAATALRKRASVHFKVDTGLTRLGAPVGEAPDRYRRIRALPGLEVDGIYTHFARADEADVTSDRDQLALFQQVLSAIGELPRLVHAAASGGVAGLGPVDRMTAIRPGIAVYGIPNPAERAAALALRPAGRSLRRWSPRSAAAFHAATSAEAGSSRRGRSSRGIARDEARRAPCRDGPPHRRVHPAAGGARGDHAHAQRDAGAGIAAARRDDARHERDAPREAPAVRRRVRSHADGPRSRRGPCEGLRAGPYGAARRGGGRGTRVLDLRLLCEEEREDHGDAPARDRPREVVGRDRRDAGSRRARGHGERIRGEDLSDR